MTAHRSITFETTGDAALDQLLGGGLPTHSVTLIAGEPGSGKTVLALQTLFHAARRGATCLYLTTLSEPAIKVIGYMQLFGFFDAALVDKRLHLIDMGGAVRAGAEPTLKALTEHIDAYEPSLVAIDSFRAIGELRAPGGTRSFVYDLAVEMAGWGTTTLLVGEYSPDEYQRFVEFAIADGIIQLGSERRGLTSVREIEILKLRGAQYTTGRHFCDISSAGMSFFPRVRAPQSVATQEVATSERVSTGVAGLDELTGGGLLRTSTTVMQGGTGTGKTILGLQFLIEGALRNERGILFSHEETPEQLRQLALGLGWDLLALERSGLLLLEYTAPVELSTDRFLFQARNLVSELKAKRAVFDSLTSMSLGVPSQRRFKQLVYAIAKHLRRLGVTSLMTMESEELLGSAALSGRGVSFVADNLIQLRYVEIEGQLERAISVIKARGTPHLTELRALTIGLGGPQVIAGRFKDLAGVLTGLPSKPR